MQILTLQQNYAEGRSIRSVLDEVTARIARQGKAPVWITLVEEHALHARAAQLHSQRDAGARLPLFGIPFAVKDNIDVAGLPTTAACPAFAYTPEKTAEAVSRLEAAGAVMIGKTNLDQFATGLVGTRSPYGICASAFSDSHVSGGSSSGSAVAVASGLVSFALGTDTAGSGRVPAAFNNIVGLKPSKGLISTSGVVPACRTLDCVSIFAATAEDASFVLTHAAAYDPADPFSRLPPANPATWPETGFRFGVPANALPDDEASQILHAASIQRLRDLGGQPVDIDFTPFARAAALLYAGPWVAERLAALRAREFNDWAAMDPTVATIVRNAEKITAAETFEGIYALAEAARAAAQVWQTIDVMLLPTTPTHPRIEAIQANPIAINSRLGSFTNFANLLDCCACAIPAGFRPDGLPYGVSLIAPAFHDDAVAALAARLHAALPQATVGATGSPLAPITLPKSAAQHIELAVVGAHLSGQPLNHELTRSGARLLRPAHSAGGYRLYALANTTPAKPALVRDATGAGHIELEIWRLSREAFGAFTAAIPPPLAIGNVTLADGTSVKGFVCEPHALQGATDITEYGGWRAWLGRTP
jgi:allophanate hydrolase